MSENRNRTPMTLRELRAMARRGEPIPVLTCYDATTAGLLDAAGVRVLLVGDSAAQMILGLPSTIHAPLEFMLQVTAAVKRGAPGSFVMGDMPFMSYQPSDAEAMHNAGRFLTEGMADAVKLEVDETQVALVEKLARTGVPVVAHIGWRPQQTVKTGTPRIAGKTAEQVRAMVDLAERLDDAGAVMLLIEQATAEATEWVVGAVDVPVIGCGAGPASHGHVIVLHDLLGMTAWHPSFAPPLAAVGEAIGEAARQWVNRVTGGDYAAGHPFHMADEEHERLGAG